MAKLNLDLGQVPQWVSKKIAEQQQGYVPDLIPGEVERRIAMCKKYPDVEFNRPKLSDLPRHEREALLQPEAPCVLTVLRRTDWHEDSEPPF